MTSITLTAHALEKLEERDIAVEWIARTVTEPVFTEPDPTQPGAVRAFKVIPECGSRVLRVVYIDEGDEGDERRIITAFLVRSRSR